jgi:hypothetical protein
MIIAESKVDLGQKPNRALPQRKRLLLRIPLRQIKATWQKTFLFTGRCDELLLTEISYF